MVHCSWGNESGREEYVEQGAEGTVGACGRVCQSRTYVRAISAGEGEKELQSMFSALALRFCGGPAVSEIHDGGPSAPAR